MAGKGYVTPAFSWARLRCRFYECAIAEGSPITSESAAAHRSALSDRDRYPRLRRGQAASRAPGAIAIRSSAELEHWLREKLAILSRKSNLAQAVRYELSHWDGLTRFLDDGRIEMNSNAVERSIRPIAFNRKNALFAGSDGGAENWAVIASLIEPCKLDDVDPYAYLVDTLMRIVDGDLASAVPEF